MTRKLLAVLSLHNPSVLGRLTIFYIYLIGPRFGLSKYKPLESVVYDAPD